MTTGPRAPRPAFRALGARHLDTLLQRAGLTATQRRRSAAVAAVFAFRTNEYVVDHLIDWSDLSNDPIYQLTFPQPGMLSPTDLHRMERLLATGAADQDVHAAANEIRFRLNPHPAGQLEHNVPQLDGRRLHGLQHKYAGTLLVFPRQGQTCHAYCTYCFRWPQFIGEPALKMATDEIADITGYLRAHPEISSVLVTGGDALVMSAEVLRRYVEPLLAIETVESIRIGTKALAYWPYRFVSDPEADDLLRLFAQVVGSGRQMALMAHYSHPRELTPPVAAEAIRRVRDTGAVIRCQAPLIRHVNDDPAIWSQLWRESIRLGLVPYYMLVARDTGPQHYFGVPLDRAYHIFRDAYATAPGLARTVRGPVMSATPGKVIVDGVADVAGERVFVLRMLQARRPELVGRPFFARHDPEAAWLSDLKPAFGASTLLPGLDPD